MKRGNIVPEPLSSILIKSRHKVDMTQQEVASKIGVSQSAYNYWESGKHFPTLRVVGKLVKVLEIDRNYFLAILLSEEEAKKK